MHMTLQFDAETYNDNWKMHENQMTIKIKECCVLWDEIICNEMSNYFVQIK